MLKRIILLSLLFAVQVWAEPIWIDVRTPEEFKQDHLEQVQHLIPYDEIEASSVIKALDKHSEIYLYCRSGNRAGIAKKTLESLGFQNVTNMGGLDDAREYVQQQATCKADVALC